MEERDLADGDLRGELCTQAAHLAVAECHFVLLVAEFDRRELWGDGVCRSCAHWLNWRCGIAVGTAREQVRVGRALEHLPKVRAAFASGELSYSKVRAITRMATPELEEELLVLARAATASQLERLSKEYRRADPKEGRNALERHRSRFLRSYTDHDGMVVIQARLSPEDGAVVLAAVEATRRALEADTDEDSETVTDTEQSSGSATENDPSEGVDSPEAVEPSGAGEATFGDVSAEATPAGEAAAATEAWEDPINAAALLAFAPEERTSEMKNVDALVVACESLLSRGVSGDGDEPRVSVLLHVDAKVTQSPSSEGCSFIEGISAVSSHTALRLACDAAVSKLVYHADGRVEPEGKTRSIPRRIRRGVLARDRGCRFPGCTMQKFLDVHHVVFWSNGGPTKPSNLVSLCRFHHRRVHEGGYALELDPSGALCVRTPEGEELPAAYPARVSTGPCQAERRFHEQSRLDSETVSYGYYDPLDYHTAVQYLYKLRKRSDDQVA